MSPQRKLLRSQSYQNWQQLSAPFLFSTRSRLSLVYIYPADIVVVVGWGLVYSTCSVIIPLHRIRSCARFIASSKLLMFRPFNCDFSVPSNVVTGLPLGFFVYLSASLSATFAGASSWSLETCLKKRSLLWANIEDQVVWFVWRYSSSFDIQLLFVHLILRTLRRSLLWNVSILWSRAFVVPHSSQL